MLDVNKSALVVIDVQGKLAQLMFEKDKLFQNLVRMVKGAKILRMPVHWNEQNPAGLGPTIPEISEILSDQRPLIKSTFSACGNPAFTSQLNAGGRKQVFLVGIETHVCVYQTAVDLISQGYHVEVVTDAVSSRTAENKQAGIERMKEAGAKLTTTEMALFELLKVAEGEKFKEILRIVK
jgi:nicotinamidase-related amidase